MSSCPPLRSRPSGTSGRPTEIRLPPGPTTSVWSTTSGAGVPDLIGLPGHSPAALLCRDCGSRRCACRRPDPRQPASAPGSRSRGRAATLVNEDLAAGPDALQKPAAGSDRARPRLMKIVRRGSHVSDRAVQSNHRLSSHGAPYLRDPRFSARWASCASSNQSRSPSFSEVGGDWDSERI
jgi:hypothetical protein